MKSILFSPDGADGLNHLVQCRIAEHLFIVCNYNVDSFPAINADAKFLQGVLNLYKFTVDAGLIGKLSQIDCDLGSVIKKKYKNDFRELSNCIEIISNLRTYTAHNNDHNETIKWVESWMTQIIYKKQMETMEDFELALKELEKIGEKTYKTTEKILHAMIQGYSKNDLRQTVEHYIVKFYQSNTRILKNELRIAYQSQARRDIKNSDLADWCLEKYCGQIWEKKSLYVSYLSRTKGNQKRKLTDAIGKLEEQELCIQKKIADFSYNGDLSKLRIYGYLDYYLDELGRKCEIMIPEIIDQKLTMLPQDMIQYIIAKDFDCVPVK